MYRRAVPSALLALGLFPAHGLAGPIEFDLYPMNLTVQPGKPALTGALDLVISPNPWRIVDSANPVVVPMEVVEYHPQNLPLPAPSDIHPDGTTHWNNDGYFGLDLRLTDTASGESADFHFAGRAHMYNVYSTGSGWSGLTDFWFRDFARVTLGGNDYTLWGANWYDTGPVTVNVWVGPNPPVSNAPEPGTFVLAMIALAPLGARFLRHS